MWKNRIFIITEVLLFLVVTGTMIFTISWLEPVTPFRHTLRIVFPLLLITYFFLFLVFRIISFYYHQLSNQKRLVEELNTAFMKLGAKLSADDILKQSLETLMDFCKGTTGAMLVLDEQLRQYTSGEIFTLNINTSLNNNYVESDGKKHYLLTFFPASIPQTVDSRIREILPRYDFDKCKTVIVIPLVGKERIRTVAIVGVTGMSRKGSAKIFEDMKSVLDIFLRQLNIEIENAMLHEEINKASITDTLTRLYNRRYFNKRAQEEFAKARRMGFPVSIMISDLDNFKNYVDTYGHPLGDIILAEVASVVSGTMRESDMVCRFGGDEFAYLLPFTSSVEARALGERIRKGVSQYVFLKNDIEKAVHITLSIGIASFPEHGQKEDEVVGKADHALFTSKNNGKNRISIYEENKGG